MHKEIDKQALKDLNKILKAHGCKVVKTADSKTRYLVKRMVQEALTHDEPGGESRGMAFRHPKKAGTVMTRWYAIGIAYGETLMGIFKDATMTHKLAGTDGWYQKGPSWETVRDYTPVSLGFEDMEKAAGLLP